MSKRQSKKKGKNKPAEIIRTDVWDLKATPEQKSQMVGTIEEYRKFLHPLVIIVNSQWVNLVDLTSKERINAVEKMIHKTADNPDPKHKYFQSVVNRHPSFRKFPSYLRRAAIADTIGIVSSFQTRHFQWQSGDRKHRHAKPPSLSAWCNTYPALYQGQQVKYRNNFQLVDIKVWSGTDWVWLECIPVKKHGLNRHLVDGNKIKSPALVVNKHTCQLSMPVEVKIVDLPESDMVCSVDMGINNAATASIVGRDGTVKARVFINPIQDIDRRNKRRMMIAHKSKQTRNITKLRQRGLGVSPSGATAVDLPKGFCKGLQRKSSNINLQISKTVARAIVEFAKTHNVKVIVFENLEGWKAKGGRRKSLQKQKFHLWCHRKIVALVTDRWTEMGGKIVFINPKYTSAYAFDGSGKVKRDKVNYSLCRFTSGKRYHSDLNASYNIAARYWYAVIMGDNSYSRVFEGKSSHGTLRTPVTLGTLRCMAASASRCTATS
ncbi:transposase [Scytonema hofmannii PCC 7110]|uniref:Transposase n=1 Tax=Scytonema hofmannii PCC 7110 TaxID=128403 RepID=A0A139WSA8_9CYAN|nr:IS200/IS605 family accessory protein TnpB-related protein [Scytonema hofmannii]KYC35309.1 transposase [Scytonema hofmannii PCC 7110]